MVDVYLDVHKDVHAGYGGDVHRHQAAVAIVHQEVCSQGSRAEVVNAAGTIGHIAQDKDVLSAGKATGRRGGALVALLEGQSRESRVGRQ